MGSITRKDAESAYKKALADYEKLCEAKLGDYTEEEHEKLFDAACAKLDAARKQLVAAEIEAPTWQERKKAEEKLRLRNRGLDV